MNEDCVSDVAQPIAVTAPPGSLVPRDLTRRLLGGTSSLGASICIERGLGFLANILAARLGGTSTFGSYSIAITSANNVATYAAAGIGSTAARFSGKYPMGSRGYKTLARVLIIISLVSALVASSGMWLGAAPIAHLLHRDNLTGLLRWTALSAAGLILLECARGFFLGHCRHAALMLLSILVGIGMIAIIPWQAHRHNPTSMIVAQGMITTLAVACCLLLAQPLGLTADAAITCEPLGPMLREVWAFGFVQLAGFIGSNLAGWWLTTLVARSDTTLVQMSFFAIASQLRNIVALPSTMLTESSYAVMADRQSGDHRTPGHVMGLCTFAASFASLSLSSLGIIFIPLLLKLVYGPAYRSAATTVAAALAVAVVHMGSGPAIARLSMVSIRATGIINTIWAIFVAITATSLLMSHGTAATAMLIYLAAHILSAVLAFSLLARWDHIPRGVLPVFTLASLTGISLASLAIYRDDHSSTVALVTLGMIAVATAAVVILLGIGRKAHWLPDTAVIQRLVRNVPSLASRLLRPTAERRA